MKPTEAAALLTIAAAYDNRKPDPDAAKAWAMALHDVRFEDCRETVVEHYRHSREWLMPSDVLNGVAEIRSDRVTRFLQLLWQLQGQKHLTPPPSLADDPAAENRWVADTFRLVRDGEITHPDQIEDGRPAIETFERHDVIAELGHIGREVPDA
jgi:hypothetical protein